MLGADLENSPIRLSLRPFQHGDLRHSCLFHGGSNLSLPLTRYLPTEFKKMHLKESVRRKVCHQLTTRCVSLTFFYCCGCKARVDFNTVQCTECCNKVRWCYGLTCAPCTDMLKSYSLGPMNVTSCGNRVFPDVMKIRLSE